MLNLENLAEQALMSIGILATEGKALPVGVLREGLARVTMNPEGYAYDDFTLDNILAAVILAVVSTGHVVLIGDKLFWKIEQAAGKVAGISDEELN
jgi:hypothetical protein